MSASSASASPAPRFTSWGTFISVPMETADRALGVGVYSSPKLAWEALRLVRTANARRASVALFPVRNGFQRIAGQAARTLMVDDASYGHIHGDDWVPGVPATGGASYGARSRDGITIWHGLRIQRRHGSRRHNRFAPVPRNRWTGVHALDCLCRACNS